MVRTPAAPRYRMAPASRNAMSATCPSRMVSSDAAERAKYTTRSSISPARSDSITTFVHAKLYRSVMTRMIAMARNVTPYSPATTLRATFSPVVKSLLVMVFEKSGCLTIGKNTDVSASGDSTVPHTTSARRGKDTPSGDTRDCPPLFMPSNDSSTSAMPISRTVYASGMSSKSMYSVRKHTSTCLKATRSASTKSDDIFRKRPLPTTVPTDAPLSLTTTSVGDRLEKNDSRKKVVRAVKKVLSTSRTTQDRQGGFWLTMAPPSTADSFADIIPKIISKDPSIPSQNSVLTKRDSSL
mmetsp:Transcript_31332/g.87859  ORF Transcript_31332/g.87859 Transcript_31332/m.87859 type:complete len:297 (-) Transcript_31332:977-1867(-)